jgi:hypothetical protein
LSLEAVGACLVELSDETLGLSQREANALGRLSDIAARGEEPEQLPATSLPSVQARMVAVEELTSR